MRTLSRVLGALLLTALPHTTLTAQTAQDSAGIRLAALDYIEGWYSGNGDRMAKALHPELAKRIMNTDTLGNYWIRDMGATELIRGTRAGGGTRTPQPDRRSDVEILDIFQNAASARIDAGGWIDYLHLVRWHGQWMIINVLWEVRQPPAKRAP